MELGIMLGMEPALQQAWLSLFPPGNVPLLLRHLHYCPAQPNAGCDSKPPASPWDVPVQKGKGCLQTLGIHTKLGFGESDISQRRNSTAH